jgi:membrane fusion protein (multidrug efflux system)
MNQGFWIERGYRILAAGLLAVLLTLSGCSKQPGGAGGGFSMPPTPVETALVVQESVADRFEAVGTVEAGEAITVVSEIDGTVVKLPFQEGGRIERGGLIALIDDVQLKAEMERAAALRDQSQSTFDRVKSVVDQGAGTPQDLDDAGAALKVAQANLELATSRFNKTRITAPFSGIAGARAISAGAFVRAGDRITRLAKLDDIRVDFSAPERYLSKMNRGAPVTISTTAYPGYELSGVIDVIEPILDEGTRSARIIAIARNPEGRFRPGMSANVVVVLSQRESAITVAAEAVFAEGSQSLVFVVKADSTVTRTPVTLGTRMANAVEVLDGLQAGDRVVRAGHQKLFEGAKVMPVDSMAAAPGGGMPGTPAAAPAETAAADSSEGDTP